MAKKKKRKKKHPAKRKASKRRAPKKRAAKKRKASKPRAVVAVVVEESLPRPKKHHAKASRFARWAFRRL
jgi:hypothetical protein